VEALKFLKHEIEELEKRKLAILLPFYVLKLRKKVVSAKTSQARAELALEMKQMMEELTAAIERAADVGLMNEADKRAVLEYTERLYRELYEEYEEFKEANVMLQNTILTYSEEAERRGIRKGRKEGKAEGRAEGRAEGKAEGKAEGRAEGKAEMARNLLRHGVAPDVIAESASLPLDKIWTLMN
jgi:flagellar biosynthesis/type III secretory pathway protein FliH